LEVLVIFALAEVTRAKQFLKADDLRAFFCRRGDTLEGFIQVGGQMIARAHLDKAQPDLVFA
jgi:hypothetical protein